MRLHTSHNISLVTRDTADKEATASIREADVIWVVHDYLPITKNGAFNIVLEHRKLPKMPARIKESTIIISNPSGTHYRRNVHGYNGFSMEIYPLSEYRKGCDLVVPTTPDLIYPGMDDVYMPMPCKKDADTQWEGYNGGKITVSAYQGHGDDRKGVQRYLLPAIDQARKLGIDVEIPHPYNVGQDVPRAIHNKQISQCTLAFEQITPIGIYGDSGGWHMTMGVPSIVGITKEAEDKAKKTISNYGEPFIKAYSVEDVLAVFINIAEGKLDLNRISKESMAYADRWLSYEVSAKRAEAYIELAIKNHAQKLTDNQYVNNRGPARVVQPTYQGGIPTRRTNCRIPRR